MDWYWWVTFGIGYTLVGLMYGGAVAREEYRTRTNLGKSAYNEATGFGALAAFFWPIGMVAQFCYRLCLQIGKLWVPEYHREVEEAEERMRVNEREYTVGRRVIEPYEGPY